MHSHKERWEVLVPMWGDQGMKPPQQPPVLPLCLPGVCTDRSPSPEMEDGCCLHYGVSNEAME